MTRAKKKSYHITSSTRRARKPTITINRVKKAIDRNDKHDINVHISEHAPNKPFEPLRSIDLTEAKTLNEAISKAKKFVHVKTATLGGKARFYYE